MAPNSNYSIHLAHAQTKCPCAASPTYETLDIGVKGDASIYQSLNSDFKPPEIRAEKTSEGLSAPVYQQPTNGDAASVYQTVNSDPAPTEA